jgi:hypothetical protein
VSVERGGVVVVVNSDGDSLVLDILDLDLELLRHGVVLYRHLKISVILDWTRSGDG